MRILIALLSLFCVLGFAKVSYSQDASKELITGWLSNLEPLQQNANIRCEMQYGEPPVISSQNVTYLADHFAVASQIANPASNINDQRTLIANPYYSARIQRKNQEWLLTEVKPADKSGYTIPEEKIQSQNMFSVVTSAGGVGTYITTENYEFESLGSKVLSGKTYSVVNSKLHSDKAKEIGALPLTQASIWFDPDQNRRFPARVEVMTDRPGKGGTYVYSDFQTVGDYELPTRVETYGGVFKVEEWTSDTPPAPAAVHKFDYSHLFSKPARGEFYLSHYGLPEPDFYTPPRPWWMYISIAGMIIIVMGAVVLHFGRRMRRG